MRRIPLILTLLLVGLFFVRQDDIPTMLTEEVAQQELRRMVFSADSPHYQTSDGAWQPVDTAFRAVEDGYVVEHNALSSHVRRSDARIAAAGGETILNWQAIGLGVASSGTYHEIASRLSADFPTRSHDNHILQFDGAWSDTTISEIVVSAAGSIEQSLILHERPTVTGETLVMQAELRLSADATLHANDKLQTTAFETDGAVEIFSADNTPDLILDPIIAYEQGNRAAQVAGRYRFTPTSDPALWQVEVQTPLAWWTDETRTYPAVLDPRIRVSSDIGSGQSLSYTSDVLGTFNGEIRLGPYYHFSEQTTGSIAFNQMATVPTASAPLYIASAHLEIRPTGFWGSLHGYCHGIAGVGFSPICSKNEVDGEAFLLQDGYQVDVRLRANTSSQFVYFESLKIGEATPQDKIEPPNPPTDQLHTYRAIADGDSALPTRVDVTMAVREWYGQLLGGNTPAPLTFEIEQVKSCDFASPYFNENEQEAHHCTVIDIQHGDVQLVIDYAPVQLAAGSLFNNAIGVPSKHAAAFGEDKTFTSDQGVDLQTTHHQYEIPNLVSGWQVIAARGDHSFTPTTDESDVGIEIWQYPLVEQPNPVPIAKSYNATDTSFVLLKGDQIASVDYRAAVTAVADSSASNTSANYTVQRISAESHTVPYSTQYTLSTQDFSPNELVHLHEFDATNGDNMSFEMTVTINPNVPVEAFPLKAYLVTPADDGILARDEVTGMPLVRAGNTLSVPSFKVQTQGRHGIVIVNDVRSPGLGRQQSGIYNYDIAITRCPKNSIAAPKFGNGFCQPIFLPPSEVGQIADKVRFVPIQNASGEYLAVFNRGEFNDINPQQGIWCTQDEQDGAPVVARVSHQNPATLLSYTGDWVVVGQGQICYDESDLLTTEESLIGMAVPEDGIPAQGVFQFAAFGKGQWPPNSAEDGETRTNADGNFAAKDGDTFYTTRPFADYEWDYTPNHQPFLDTTAMELRGDDHVAAAVQIGGDQAVQSAEWDVAWSIKPQPDPVTDNTPVVDFQTQAVQTQQLPSPFSFSGLELRFAPEAGGAFTQVDWLMQGGPDVYQFQAEFSRVTASANIGHATALNDAIIPAPGIVRPTDTTCQQNGTPVNCLDLRHRDYVWAVQGKHDTQEIRAWTMPDLHITGAAASLLVSREGQFEAFSADHPNAQALSVPFSFDTWGGEVSVSEGACGAGGPITTLVTGAGYIALPMIGINAPKAGEKGIDMRFTLCETALHELRISYTPDAPLPLGNTGLGMTLLGGEIVVGPDSTRIVLNINFQSHPDGNLLTGGVGTVTLDTAGLLTLDASGTLVGKFDADFRLDVAWNPLDLLLRGDVRYPGGLITGYLQLHAWRGSGWQNKYPHITDHNMHFAGTIGGTIRVPRGELIDGPGPLDLPPTTFSISANISFGEFCRNSGCTTYEWGVAATINVLGYKAGVYVSDGGPEIILGAQGKVLIDQHGGNRAALPRPTRNITQYAQALPGDVQASLIQGWIDPFAGVQLINGSENCAPNQNGFLACSFDFPLNPNDAGRAIWSVSWQKDNISVALTDPNFNTYTATDTSAGVFIESNPYQRTITLDPSVNGNTITDGTWLLRLGFVTNDTYFSIAHAYAAPVPTLELLTPANVGTNAGSIYQVDWLAQRGGAAIEADVDLELMYAPIFQPDPIPQEGLTVSFPGDYMAVSGLGSNWDVGEPNVTVTDDNGDGVYRFSAEITTPDDYEYAVAINGTYEESYGAHGTRGGAPAQLSVDGATDQPVRFYYDRRDNTVFDSTQGDVVVLAGDMLSEIGGADWSADNLVGWMKRNELDQYETVLSLPAGDWLYKVALNESWTVNYGQGGAPDGAAIPLHVPQDGTAVRFIYDPITHIISHTTAAPLAGIPLSLIKAVDGSYLWNTGGLASGEYLVGARLNDIDNANGIITAWADGTIVINDTTPPPDPIPLATIKRPLAAGPFAPVVWEARWRPVSAPDLAGYQIEYDIHDTDLALTIPVVRRVVPSDPLGLSNESLLLGGFVQSSNNPTVCIRAYDASGNLSGCAPFAVILAGNPQQPLDAPDFENTAAFSDGTLLTVTWPPVGGVQNGYVVRYGLAGCHVPNAVVVADEGVSPLFTNVESIQLTGLTPNQLYWFEVRAIGANGFEGLPQTVTAMLIDVAPPTSGDGVPDAWQLFYDLPVFASVNQDSDRDGLTDRAEYLALSNPRHADSDGDGHYDGVEAAAGTDVCDPNDHPAAFDQSRLRLFGQATYKLAISLSATAPVEGSVQVVNFGSGEMVWTAQNSAEWLQLNPTSMTGDGTLTFSVTPAALEAAALDIGTYTAVISVTTQPQTGGAVPFISETATVVVELTVLSADYVPTAIQLSNVMAEPRRYHAGLLVVALMLLTIWLLREEDGKFSFRFGLSHHSRKSGG